MFVACAILLRTEMSDTQKAVAFLTGAVTILPSEHLCSWEPLLRREERTVTGRYFWPALLTCVCRELAGTMPGKLGQVASDGPPCHCGVTLLSLG